MLSRFEGADRVLKLLHYTTTYTTTTTNTTTTTTISIKGENDGHRERERWMSLLRQTVWFLSESCWYVHHSLE